MISFLFFFFLYSDVVECYRFLKQGRYYSHYSYSYFLIFILGIGGVGGDVMERYCFLKKRKEDFLLLLLLLLLISIEVIGCVADDVMQRYRFLKEERRHARCAQDTDTDTETDTDTDTQEDARHTDTERQRHETSAGTQEGNAARREGGWEGGRSASDTGEGHRRGAHERAARRREHTTTPTAHIQHNASEETRKKQGKGGEKARGNTEWERLRDM